MTSSRGPLAWILFVSLCLIWGSSFMLMKKSLDHLSSFQVASFRIFCAGAVMAPWAVRALRKMPQRLIIPVFISGLLGSLLPAFFYSVAQEKVESSLAGSLNSLTPIFVIIVGVLFFGARIGKNQVLGVLISFSGSTLLFLRQPGFGMESHGPSVLLILLATIAYGLNVNVVNRFLIGVNSVDIAAVALSLIAFPAGIVLWKTGFFSMDWNAGFAEAAGYAAALGLLGTALASVLFYVLIKEAGMVFASMVTYGIPVIANLWGFRDGEQVGVIQLVCLGLILTGVFWATRRSPGS